MAIHLVKASNQYMTVANYAAAQFNSGACTISCWVRFSTETTGNFINFQNATGGQAFLNLSYNHTSHVFDFGRGKENVEQHDATYSLTPTVGVWYHVVGVFAGTGTGAMQVYVNGAAGTGSTDTTTANTFTTTFYIGVAYTGTNPFDGDLADLAFWNVALTTKEISALASGVSASQIRPSSLKMYFPFDSASLTANLAPVAKNQGVLVNTPTVTTHAPVGRYAPRRESITIFAQTITKTHTTDSLLLKTKTSTHTTDSYLTPVKKTHTTDSLLSKTKTVTHTTDSYLIVGTVTATISHTTDSLLLKTKTVTHTTDSYLTPVKKTHTTDSYIRFPQYARPINDNEGFGAGGFGTNWKNELGTGFNAWESINEITPNDSTYIISPTNPPIFSIYSSSYISLLSKIFPPVSAGYAVVRYRIRKQGSKTATLDITLTNDTDGDIKDSVETLNTTWTDGSFTLTSAEVASITDYDTLKITLSASTSGGGTDTTCQLSWIEVEFPYNTPSKIKLHTTDSFIDQDGCPWLWSSGSTLERNDGLDWLLNHCVVWHSTDSYLTSVTTQTKTHTTDSLLLKTQTKIHTTDSYLTPVKKTHTTDSLLLKTESQTHTTDSYLTPVKKTHTTDSLLLKTQTLTHTTDSLLLKTESQSHTTDSLLSKTKTLTHTTDSLLLKTETQTHTTDSYLTPVKKIHTTDSLLLKTETQTHTTDSLLLKTQTQTHTTDSLLLKTQTKTHTTDSLLLKTQTNTHTTDSYLTPVKKIHTTDSFLLKTQTQTHTTDSLLLKTESQAQTTDSLLLKTNTKTHTTDSLLLKTESQTHTTDSYLTPVKKTHTTDSLLLKTESQTHTTDSLLLKTETSTHTTDSLLEKTSTKTHTTDSFISQANAVTHTTDSLLLKTETSTHNTDSLLLKTQTSAHTTDSLLLRTESDSHTTDSLLLKTNTVTHTTDSLLLKTEIQTHTTDSFLLSANARTHTTDSLLLKTETVTHTTDSLLLKTNTNTHTTDSFLSSRDTNNHTTDSLLEKTQTTEHTTDSYLITSTGGGGAQDGSDWGDSTQWTPTSHTVIISYERKIFVDLRIIYSEDIKETTRTIDLELEIAKDYTINLPIEATITKKRDKYLRMKVNIVKEFGLKTEISAYISQNRDKMARIKADIQQIHVIDTDLSYSIDARLENTQKDLDKIQKIAKKKKLARAALNLLSEDL